MTHPAHGAEPESLRDLATRVIDDGKAYLQAEVRVVKQTVSTKVGQIGPAAGLLAGALLLVQAALTVLAAALGLLLAQWLGSAGGFAVAALIVLALAGLLAWIALRRIGNIAK